MGLSYLFALLKLQASQKFCAQVYVDRVSNTAQGAERTERLSIQANNSKR